MNITVKAIIYSDKVLYQETYRAANIGKAYDMFIKDHPDVKHIGKVHHIEWESQA